MELVVASNNQHKIKEIRQILSGKFEKIYSLKDLGISINTIEDGETLFANAYKKAKEVCDALNLPSLADDTGLLVDVLNGLPGVKTARYAGDNATDDENNAKLLNNLKGVEKRSAKFVTSMVLCFPNGKYLEGVGEVCGRIELEKNGQFGFGYDPVFFCTELNKTFGNSTDDEKNAVSHRSKALYNLLEKLKDEKI